MSSGIAMKDQSVNKQNFIQEGFAAFDSTFHRQPF